MFRLPALSIVSLCLVMVSCKFSPDQLADDYCECMKKYEAKKGTLEECTEMAESHYLRLQEEPEALDTYSKHISECLMYDDIRTEDDIKEYRRKKRGNQ